MKEEQEESLLNPIKDEDWTRKSIKLKLGLRNLSDISITF